MNIFRRTVSIGGFPSSKINDHVSTVLIAVDRNGITQQYICFISFPIYEHCSVINAVTLTYKTPLISSLKAKDLWHSRQPANRVRHCSDFFINSDISFTNRTSSSRSSSIGYLGDFQTAKKRGAETVGRYAGRIFRSVTSSRPTVFRVYCCRVIRVYGPGMSTLLLSTKLSVLYIQVRSP